MPEKKEWLYEEVDAPDWLADAKPEGYSLRFFYVTSGDSGKTYMIQMLKKAGRLKPIFQCQCTDGFMRSLLAQLKCIVNCKHVRFLEQKLPGLKRI